MAVTDFTRSNVSENTLNVSSPGQSSFDHYSRSHHGIPLGKFVPVMVKPMMPNSVISGAVTPEYTLYNVGTPNIGPARQDTHTIAVSARRINRDWKFLIEDKEGYQTIPQFNVASIFSRVMTFLCGGSPSELQSKYATGSSWNTERFMDTVCGVYLDLINGGVAYGFGLHQDWFAVEVTRLRSLPVSASSPWSEFVNLLYEIARPYFGEGSILDNLKYPIFSFYGEALSILNHNTLAGDEFEGLEDFSEVFRLNGVNSQSGVWFTHPLENYIVNEMLLRAQYAAWYDSLRNWHVEERHSLPDPDTWGMQSYFYPATPDLKQIFLSTICLLLPRYRCYGSDAFTTVQTDAAFRHVFNPIFGDNMPGPGLNDQKFGSAFEVGSSGSDDILNGIYNVIIQGASMVFPQGIFRRDSNGISNLSSLHSDLKTMRRAGMLETYLARDYYFPDTYEGRMRAHHGIAPSDILGSASKYISGTESFITGDQQIASTNGNDGYTGTPAGTRTFTGGSASNGMVQFASEGDYIFLVTFSSLQPIVTYDAKDMYLSTLTRADLPFHEFANDANVAIMARDMIRGIEGNDTILGYVPRFYGWRTDMDSVHGPYLRELRSLVWLRDWYSTSHALGSTLPFHGNASAFAISAYGLHVHLPLDAFTGSFQGDDWVLYGSVTFNYSIQAPLPAAVMNI